MKKISQLAAFLTILVSFSLPLSVSAADASCAYAGSAGNQCVQSGVSGYCDASGFCRPSSAGGTVSSSGGGINLNAIAPYKAGILSLINAVFVPVLFAIAFLTFLWGVYKYFILGATEEKSREEGRNFVLWGIIGFVVILSVWGLVAVVVDTFNLSPGGAAPSYPTL